MVNKKTVKKSAPKAAAKKAPKKKAVKEKNLEVRFRDWCREKGWECVKLVDEGDGGHPDRTVRFGVGRSVYVELKSTGGKLRPDQKNYIRRMINRGELVLLTDEFEEACQWVSLCHSYMFRIDTKIQPSDLLSPKLLELVDRVGRASS